MLIANAHGPETRSRAVALFATSQLVGVAVGGSLSGYIAELLHWRVSFWLLGGCGLLFAIPLWRFLASVPPHFNGSPTREKADSIKDQDLLREVMNTVGKEGQLGEQIRCVVSVSMLTEGWDANTVTHVVGVRAFGTQLLCEQVIGRALRRQSYDLNDDNLFNVEYADVLGIPFDFNAKPVIAPPQPPRQVQRPVSNSRQMDTECDQRCRHGERPDPRQANYFTFDALPAGTDLGGG